MKNIFKLQITRMIAETLSRLFCTFALLVAIAFSMAACSSEDSGGSGGNKFTGTWKNQQTYQGKSYSIEYKFYNDSNFIFRYYEGGKRLNYFFGTFEFTDKTITFSSFSDSSVWTQNYTMSGKTLNLEQDAARHWAGEYTKADVSYGLFTMTDIPSQYEGKYAVCFINTDQSGNRLWGYPDNDSKRNMVLTRINNGKVVLPLNVGGTWEEYKGNDTYYVFVNVYEPATIYNLDAPRLDIARFAQVKFTNGSAVKSWKDSPIHGVEKKGTITIADIPSQYNGKYAIFFAHSPYDVYGTQGNDSKGNMVLTKISDGKAAIPVSTYNNGNDTFKNAYVKIYEPASIYNLDVSSLETVMFGSVKFTNGDAAISWNERKK